MAIERHGAKIALEQHKGSLRGSKINKSAILITENMPFWCPKTVKCWVLVSTITLEKLLGDMDVF